MKTALDLLINIRLFFSVLFFSIICAIYNFIPFFSINKNDDYLSLIDVSISTCFLFAYVYCTYLISSYISASIANRSMINMIVKPGGIRSYLFDLIFSAIVISFVFYLLGFSIRLFSIDGSSSQQLHESFFLYYAVSALSSIIYILWTIPLCLFFNPIVGLVLSYSLFCLTIYFDDLYFIKSKFIIMGDGIFSEVAISYDFVLEYLIFAALSVLVIYVISYLCVLRVEK